MRFQERDAKFIQWINGFGFATAEQIQKYMNTGSSVTYNRMKKLVET